VPYEQIPEHRVLLAGFSDSAHKRLGGILQSLCLAKLPLLFSDCLVHPHIYLRENQVDRDEQSA
jgi:hypothetical protein